MPDGSGLTDSEKGMVIKMRKLELSDRLQAVADMVTRGNVVCDVGCDHGFVSIYLVRSGISPKVIAMDVNEGPLQAAREHIAEYLQADYIELRLSDGVQELRHGEVQTLLLAGMGGRLMKRILDEGKDKLSGLQELILQPQSELRGMRKYLRNKGYLIIEENMILEEGKYYPIMKVRAGSVPSLEEAQQRVLDKYGPVLLRGRHPVLREYLNREYSICMEILENIRNYGSGEKKRESEIRDKINDITAALSYFLN